MDDQRQDNLLEPIYSSSVSIQNVALKTYLEWWTIETGGERGLGRLLLVVRYDGDGVKKIVKSKIVIVLSTVCPIVPLNAWTGLLLTPVIYL